MEDNAKLKRNNESYLYYSILSSRNPLIVYSKSIVGSLVFKSKSLIIYYKEKDYINTIAIQICNLLPLSYFLNVTSITKTPKKYLCTRYPIPNNNSF